MYFRKSYGLSALAVLSMAVASAEIEGTTASRAKHSDENSVVSAGGGREKALELIRERSQAGATLSLDDHFLRTNHNPHRPQRMLKSSKSASRKKKTQREQDSSSTYYGIGVSIPHTQTQSPQSYQQEQQQLQYQYQQQRGSKSKSSSSSSKKSGGGGGRPPPPPTQSPGGNLCQLRRLRFMQLTAFQPPIYVNPALPDDQTVGTQYVYNDALFDPDSLDELPNSKASGLCTRIQSRTNIGGELQLGGGHCTFVYEMRDGNEMITFSVTGTIMDSMGGILPITGGAKALSGGVVGEIEILPVNLAADGGYEREDGKLLYNIESKSRRIPKQQLQLTRSFLLPSPFLFLFITRGCLLTTIAVPGRCFSHRTMLKSRNSYPSCKNFRSQQ